jgi:subtilase family serine protease
MDPPLGLLPFDPPAEVMGTETPVPTTYWPLGVEQGVVNPEENMRAVITFPLRNQAELEARIAAMYNPSSPQFRRYMTVAEFMASYAPAQDSVDATAAWLTSKGFKVALTARNRLLLYYTGTVGQWNAAFGTTLHHMKRSLIYVFNEAIAANQAQVLSDSFAHAEASSPAAVARTYNEAAMMAAALGITVLSASGDSNQVDMPSNSPYVTAVGGTNIELNTDGSWKHEQSWEYGGCGRSKVFAQPSWQKGFYSKANGQRTVADVGVVVGPSWVKFLGSWTYADGTSGSTPVFGAMLLLIDQSRKAQGKPALGFINSLIYQNAAARGAFRDIVDQGTGGCATLVGYDLATGIGSPKAAELAAVMP